MRVKLLLLGLLFLFKPCFSEEISPFVLSSSGSGKALVEKKFSYLLNPALAGFYEKNKAGISFGLKNIRKTLAISVFDLTSGLPFAITYENDWELNFLKTKEHLLTLSSGFPVSRNFSFGASVGRAFLEKAWDASVGSYFKLNDSLGLAFVLDRLFKVEGEFDMLSTLSVSYKWKKFFSSSLDISRTWDKQWIFKGGVESFFYDYLSIILSGVFFNEDKSHLISGGLNFQAPKIFASYNLGVNDVRQISQSLSLGLEF